MSATPKRRSTSATSTRSTTSGRTTSRRSTSRPTTSRRTSTARAPRGYPRRRRRTPGLSTTIGGALGTLIVTALLDTGWPVRIALFAAVVLVGLAVILWKHRAEIAAQAQADGIPADEQDDLVTDPPTDPPSDTRSDTPTDTPTDAPTQGDHP